MKKKIDLTRFDTLHCYILFISKISISSKSNSCPNLPAMKIAARREIRRDISEVCFVYPQKPNVRGGR